MTNIIRLQAFEVWIWRPMMKVPWTEHKTNEEILKMVETERKLMDTVRSRQKRWLGHIRRHDSLLRITLEGQIQGKNAYERPRTMFLDWLLVTKMFAQDRSRWSQWRCRPVTWQNTAERDRQRRRERVLTIDCTLLTSGIKAPSNPMIRSSKCCWNSSSCRVLQLNKAVSSQQIQQIMSDNSFRN